MVSGIEVAAVITSMCVGLATLIAACVAAWNALHARREGRTYNETTMGGLAAANETRRVEAIAHDERTAQEQRHLDDAPQPDDPQGPVR